MKILGLISTGAMAIALCSVIPAAAQETAPQASAEDTQDAIIVTGTRTVGMRAIESPTPIQVLTSESLQRTGSPDMVQSLAQNLPSVQAQAFGSDLQAHNLQMKLRGLSPNHTLILVNGKRRHGTANVSVAGGPYGGSAAPDISFIVPESIGHVEVLQDGAAAQYGTDAIAGVINFIQKNADEGGSINATAGEYYDGGGRTYSVSGNIGLAPIEGMYLNIAAQKKRKGYSFRGDINPEATSLVGRYPDIANLPGYPYTNLISGDPQINQTVVTYNAGYEFGDDFELYSFGSYGHKKARAWENTRNPTVISKTVDPDGSFVAPSARNGNETSVLLYPGGFQPREMIDETDYSFTGGFKGAVGETNFDLASTYGKDIVRVHVENSGNAQLYRDTGFTPTFFHNGDFIATQWSNTLDLTHAFDVGLGGPLNVAAGLEYRRETYEIVSGDPASYYGAGAQSFFGYSPNDAGKYTRKNFSQYLDISVKPVEAWLIDGAVRHEHYSDFGNTTVFKLTSRYDLSEALAVRGTVSTGFRAPTLAEGGYSGVNVGPSGVSGVLPASSAAAQALGFGGLGPEKSTNYSAGIVFKPAPKLTITLDAYHITIRNRIVISSAFYGFRGPFCPQGYRESGAFDANRCNAFNAAAYALNNQSAVQNAVAGVLGGEIPSYVLLNTNGTRNIDGSVSVQTFANGVKMRTTGIDLVANYSADLGGLGGLDLTLTGNYNKNEVLNVSAPPSTLNVPGAALIDRYSLVQLEKSTPEFRATFNAFWTLGNFSANLRESYYSKVYALEQSAGNSPLAGADMQVPVKSAFITDLELGYKVAEPIKLFVGANNLFNKYPTKRSFENIRGPQLAGNSRTYSTNLYPTISPFGINGGYYYARISLNW